MKRAYASRVKLRCATWNLESCSSASPRTASRRAAMWLCRTGLMYEAVKRGASCRADLGRRSPPRIGASTTQRRTAHVAVCRIPLTIVLLISIRNIGRASVAALLNDRTGTPEHFVTNRQIREPAEARLSHNAGLCTFRRNVARYGGRRRRIYQSGSRMWPPRGHAACRSR